MIMDEAPPRDLTNLIVNYIPSVMTGKELRQLFEEWGEVESARIIIDRQTNQSKGYGFVKYRHEASALVAMAKMNGRELHNKQLKVTPARGRQSSNAYNPCYHGRVAVLPLTMPSFLPYTGMGSTQLFPPGTILVPHAPVVQVQPPVVYMDGNWNSIAPPFTVGGLEQQLPVFGAYQPCFRPPSAYYVHSGVTAGTTFHSMQASLESRLMPQGSSIAMAGGGRWSAGFD